MEHKKWVILCIIGGALMLLSSVIGRVGFLGTLITLLIGVVTPEIQLILEIVLTVFSYIAAAGGLAVIIGAFVAGFSSNFAGRLIVGLGIGSSLISLIILVITSIYGGSTIGDLPSILLTTFNSAYGLAGVIIAIIARRNLKD
ncbi:MAG: hypothetical protein KAX18_08940 [Candidatus Lokiarchaeota archaeon]|nr:hypothetical protein [Candidatus Lokiarchaeota archaeon]